MLRALVVVLLLANAAVLAWNLGALDGLLGRRPDAEREPERLQRQVNPELVKLLPPPGASAPAAPASPVTAASSPVVPAVAAVAAAAPLCLEAGPMPATALPGAEKALLAAGVRAGSWETTAAERKGVFLIYMGRYEDDETLQRKLEELKRRRIEAQTVRHAELQPGIEVARFDDKEEAEAALARLSQRGLRTARVLTLVPPQPQLVLRLSAADPGLADALAQLKLPPGGSGFGRCAAPPEPAPPGARAMTVAASAPAAAVPAALGSAARPAASRPRPAVSTTTGSEAASSTAAPAGPAARGASAGSASSAP